jgi:hypothetical protein
VPVKIALASERLQGAAGSSIAMIGDPFLFPEAISMSRSKAPIPKTFYSLQAVSRMLGIPKPTIDAVFNKNSPLDSIQALKPIAHLFVRFEEDGAYSYAIPKKKFDWWQKTGNCQKPDKAKNIRCDAPPFYEKFKSDIDKFNDKHSQRVRYQTVIHIALKEYMDRHVEIFPPDKTGVGIDGR